MKVTIEDLINGTYKKPQFKLDIMSSEHTGTIRMFYCYYAGWKWLLKHPHKLLSFLYGMDIFIHKVPLLKMLLLFNIIMWIVMWIVK